MRRPFPTRPGWLRRSLIVGAVVLLGACAAPPSEQGAPPTGGTLNVAIGEEAGVLDPHVSPLCARARYSPQPTLTTAQCSPRR